MLPLQGSASESSALKLDGFASGIFHIVRDRGDHHHQHPFVNINRCYSVRHLYPPGEEVAERATEKYAPLRAYALPQRKDNVTKIGSNTGVPDQTPSRPQHLQSDNRPLPFLTTRHATAAGAYFHHLWWAAGPRDSLNGRGSVCGHKGKVRRSSD